MKRFTKCASKLDFAIDIDYALNYLKKHKKLDHLLYLIDLDSTCFEYLRNWSDDFDTYLALNRLTEFSIACLLQENFMYFVVQEEYDCDLDVRSPECPPKLEEFIKERFKLNPDDLLFQEMMFLYLKTILPSVSKFIKQAIKDGKVYQYVKRYTWRQMPNIKEVRRDSWFLRERSAFYRVKRINYHNFTMKHDGFDALDYEDD